MHLRMEFDFGVGPTCFLTTFIPLWNLFSYLLHHQYFWSRSGNLDMIGSYLRWVTTIALFTCALITIPSNLVIISSLRQRVRAKQRLQVQSLHARIEEVKITIVLLGVSFIFFFFTIPNRWELVTIVVIYWIFDTKDPDPDHGHLQLQPPRLVRGPDLDKLPYQGCSQLFLLLLCFCRM